MNEFHLAT